MCSRFVPNTSTLTFGDSCFQILVYATELFILPRWISREEPRIHILVEKTIPKERVKQVNPVESLAKAEVLK